MQVMRNEKLIKNRARLGTYATLGGLAILVGGMIASFRTQTLWISLGALILGFILSQYGNYNLRRWGSSPRPDQVIENGLKGFDDRYHLYAWSLPAPFVLLSPQGIYALVTRDQTGRISVSGSRWKSKMTLGRALMVFAQEGLGNPSAEATDLAERTEQWIKKTAPDLQVSVQPVVVFVRDRVELQVDEPAVPVMEAKNLKKWLRGAGKRESLPASDYRALEQLFDRASGQG